jgi:hypothetical protein
MKRCNANADFEGSEQLPHADPNKTCKVFDSNPPRQVLLDMIDDPIQLPSSQAPS